MGRVLARVLKPAASSWVIMKVAKLGFVAYSVV